MIRLHALGSLELRNAAGQSIPAVLAQPKRLALLVYLAASSGEAHIQRDTLLGMFWPDYDEARARAALSKALHYLRRSLGGSAIVTRGPGEVGLNRDVVWSDVAAFGQAVRSGDSGAALALYRGELLCGFHLADAPGFSRWLEDARAATRAQALKVAVAASASAEACGELERALRLAREAAVLAPDDEQVARRVMELLDRSGDRAGAIAVYTAFARRLEQEWELEPSPETAQLAATIRRRCDPSSTPPAPDSADRRVATNRTATPPPLAAAGSAAVAVAGTAARSRTATAGPTRRTLLAMLGLAAFAWAVVAWSDSADTPEESRSILVLPFENRTGDPALNAAGALAADWIVQGLTAAALVDVVDPATALFASRADDPADVERFIRRSRARYVVTGSMHQRQDSLWYSARISDSRTGRVLRALQPVGTKVSDPAAGVHEIREYLMGAVASIVDSRIAMLAPIGSVPPSYPAYQEFVSGLLLFQRDIHGSVDHFRRAAQRDTGFALPLIWGALAAHYSFDRALLTVRDTFMGRLDSRRGSLPPLDKLALEYLEAVRRNDTIATFLTAGRAAQMAPQSLWAYTHGFELNRKRRFREAAAVLSRIEPGTGWVTTWQLPYYNTLAWALHEAGDYDAWIASAQERLQNLPDLDSRASLVDAYGAAGRVADVERILQEMADQPVEALGLRTAAAGELHTHGHTEAARQLLTAGVLQLRFMPAELRASSDARRHHADLLYGLGRWSDSEVLYRELHEERPRDVGVLTRIGLVALRQGDHAEAERVHALLGDSGAHPAQIRLLQAQLASVRGDRERAMELLREAVAAGFMLSQVAHGMDWDELRDYPPRRALVAEVR